jgi:hypothetical protein
MHLRKSFWFIILVGLLVVSCSGKKAAEEKASKSKAAETEKLSADHFPAPRGFDVMSPSVIDTLREKRRKYNITRDDYWKNKGGVIANDYFEIWYPPGKVTITHAVYLLEQASLAKRHFFSLFGTVPKGPVILVTPADLTTYKKRTGREWWYYSAIKGDTLIFEPIYVLVKRGLGPLAVSHEYYQWAIRRISHGNAPRWLEEGMASYMSNEEEILRSQLQEFKNLPLAMTPETVEKTLVFEKQRETSRIAYYNAFKMVDTMVTEFGQKQVVDFILKLGEEGNVDKACSTVFHMPYKKVLNLAANYEN